MIESIIKDKLVAVNVITIDKSSGRITKLERVLQECVNLIQYPEGEFQKRKEVVHTVILHKINFINSK